MKFCKWLLVPALGLLCAASFQVLADKSPEKFALIVGINEYRYVQKLEGSVQDARDMKEVLQSKFEFPENRILVLTDEQATHEAIINAFKSHLIESARNNPNAIIVFHYSGHGSQAEDRNGDEADGLDETIVPVNSRDPEDRNFDITDDELDELFDELSRFTPNTTFILDSCHSGSATRGESSRLTAREVAQDKRRQPSQKPVARTRSADSQNVDMLPKNERYVTISGCMAQERSYETVNGKKRNGAFTFYLVEALRRASPSTSYREMLGQVATAVSLNNPNQHPQIEGALDRAVLAGAASREAAFITIEKVEGRAITVKAGATQGVKEGTMIAVYAPDARELTGDEKKLTNATVTKVTAFNAVAEMPEPVSIPEKSKAVLISPNSSAARLRVMVDKTESGNKLLAEKVKANDWLELDESDGWDVAVMRGKYGPVFEGRRAKNALSAAGKDANLPASNADVYFLAARDGLPVFGLFVAVDDPAGAEKIIDALDKLAKQRNLKALSNEASSIKNRIRINVWRVEGARDATGKFQISREEPVTANGLDYAFDQSERFRLEIKNESGVPLHIAVFDISTDGGIDLMHPPRGSKEKLDPGASVKTPVYKTTGPAGYETFKVIATVEYVDYGLLRQSAITRESPISPLATLMSMAMGQTRALSVRENRARLDQWATAQINFAISTEVKQ
ncbi:MAG: caspase family protein [Blastocatellia bacterium]